MTNPEELQLTTVPTAVEPTLDVLEQPFFHRLGNTIANWGRESWEPGHRAGRLAMSGVALGAKAFENIRGLVFLLPATFTKTQTYAYEHGWTAYQTASASGLALGGVYAACAYTFGKSTQLVAENYPKTTEVISHNHPAFVSTLRKASTGMPSLEDLQESQPEKPGEGYEVGPYDTKNSWLGKLSLAASRSLTAGLAMGPTPHAGMPVVDGHSHRSVNRRLRTVVAEATGFYTALGASLSAMISNNALGMADGIKNTLENKLFLSSLTAGLIGWAFTANRLAQRKEKRALETQAQLELDHAIAE